MKILYNKFFANKSKILICASIIAVITLFIINPQSNMIACYNGLSVWAKSLVPALLPFFFLTKILASTGFLNSFSKVLSPITSKLFNTPGCSGYVYLMSIISGYPVGAKLTSDLYQSGTITQGQAERITSFTCTSGPLFVLGTVGVGMFGSFRLGVLVLVCHLTGALLNGLIYRQHKLNDNNNRTFTLSSSNLSLQDAMLDSISSVMVVGGYVTIFFMIITMLNDYHLFSPIVSIVSTILPFDNTPFVANSICNGLVEMTRGCLDLSTINLPITATLPIVTAIISFGGFSIHMQALTFLKKFNISTKFYMLQKTTQTIISTLLAIIISVVL